MGNCCNATPDQQVQAIQTANGQKPLQHINNGEFITEAAPVPVNTQQQLKAAVLNPDFFKPRDEIKAMVVKYGMPDLNWNNYHGCNNPMDTILGSDYQYFGQLKPGNQFDGIGQLLTSNSLHIGYFKAGKKTGSSRTYLSQNRYIKATWDSDEIHGKCFYEDNDLGHNSTIEYVRGMKEGAGIEKWDDGTIFKGRYQNDVREGEGEMTWSDGNSFKGEFRKGCIDGKGKYVWSDGKTYEGDWKQDKMHGQGTFSWPDGRKYVGSYIEDQKEGHGIFYWSDKKKYDGQWLKGKQHGSGKYYDGTGVCKEGFWNQGQFTNPSK